MAEKDLLLDVEGNLDLPETAPKEPPKQESEFYYNLNTLFINEEKMTDEFPVLFRLVAVMIKASAFIFRNPQSLRFNETVVLNAVVKRLRNMMPGDYV